MFVVDFVRTIIKQKTLFAVGVPDSQLRALCDYLMLKYGICKQHIVAANEGNCVAIAAGHYLATEEIPLVYLQNSGVGNIINPVESLTKIYKIPCIFVVGWRGEPDTMDEPQHLFQGASTLELLNVLDIPVFNLRKETTEEELQKVVGLFQTCLENGNSVAYLVSKGALQIDDKFEYKNNNRLCREDALEQILRIANNDIIVSSTGKISREIYEIRERNGHSHEKDFLTVGSMGHCSSIAYGIAMSVPDKKVWCIDGDGALLMHLGATAVIGSSKLPNLIHVVMNNEAHESVGGMPTVASKLDLISIAKGCGYTYAIKVSDEFQLKQALTEAKAINQSCFIEVKISIASRSDLGRPKESPVENRNLFMSFIAKESGVK